MKSSVFRSAPGVFVLVCLSKQSASAAVQASVKKTAYPRYVRSRIESVLDTLQQDHQYDSASATLQSIFDQTVLYAPSDQLESIRQADAACRLVTQLSSLSAARANSLLPYLRKHKELADALVFLIRSDQKNPNRVYQILDKLRVARGVQLDQYVTLAAAICVVQQEPVTRSMNENRVRSADAGDIFNYYVKNQSRMFFGMKNVPAELLVYVVDTTASIADMQWALDKYAGTADVGSLFFTIDYDYDYLKRGTGKTVTVKGYNLPNILKYGGVRIDQAYFSTSVGKAIGVPTALDIGESDEAAHAWAGFLQYTGRSAVWNFDSGRYEAFQGVRGSVLDPQSRRDVPDSYVSLLGEMIGTGAVDRQNAVALTDAADRLVELGGLLNPVKPPSTDAVVKQSVMAKPRHTDVATQLDLIELALKQSVAYPPAWFAVRDLATARKLNEAQKQQWSDVLLKLGAKKYPDFTLEVLMPMVQTIDDPQQQDELLSRMLPLFAGRVDLSAQIRMTQARLWESKNQPDRAGQCYMDVVERYPNGGPFVMDALAGAEKLLRADGRADQIAGLYGLAWSHTKKPDGFAIQFLEQSNWYRIGKAYADRLNQTDQSSKSAEVESKLAP